MPSGVYEGDKDSTEVHIEIWASKTPEEMEEFGETMKSIWTPEMRLAQSKRMADRNRERARERREKGLHYYYEGQAERTREGLRELFSAPEDKEYYLEAMARGRQAKPNGREAYLGELLEEIAPGDFKYNDGWFILDGKIPDFVNVNGKKQVIEMFGEYYHGPGDEEKRTKFYKSFGYDLFVVWELDLIPLPDEDMESRLRDFLRRTQ